MIETNLCAGVSLRGYRRGEPCGAIAKYDARGKRYCASHYVVALKEPARFRSAIEAWVRGEARREASRRQVAAQIDAFPVLADADLMEGQDACCDGCKTGTSDCDINPLKARP